MKIRTVRAELFHADGRTDRRTDLTKLIVAFRNFADAPKNRKPPPPHILISVCLCFDITTPFVYSVTTVMAFTFY